MSSRDGQGDPPEAVGKSAALRARLAAVGITLDEPTARKPAAVSSSAPIEVDRVLVRAILVAAGAPRRDRDWLTASCPSIELARTYRPPSPQTVVPVRYAEVQDLTSQETDRDAAFDRDDENRIEPE